MTHSAEIDAAACECFVTDPSTWLSAASCGYGSGYEPGSQMEWNPDCPAHPACRMRIEKVETGEWEAWCRAHPLPNGDTGVVFDTHPEALAHAIAHRPTPPGVPQAAPKDNTR